MMLHNKNNIILTIIGLFLIILPFVIFYSTEVDERIILLMCPFGISLFAGGIASMIPKLSNISGKHIMITGVVIIFASIVSLQIIPYVTTTIRDTSFMLSIFGIGITTLGGLKMLYKKNN